MTTATEQVNGQLRFGEAISFEAFDLAPENQRILGPPHPSNTVTPLALRLTEESQKPSLDEVVKTIQSLQKDGTLTKQLARHGTLLFRGLPIRDANEFSKFGHAFGWKPHEFIGIVIDRPRLGPNVAPANIAPPEALFYNHNESPGVPHAPGYIMFFNQKAPKKGGGQPVSSCLELFNHVQREMPELINKLVEHGFMSKITYNWEKQFPGSATLYQSFGKEIVEGDDEDTKRQKVEKQLRRYNRGTHTTWEWTDEGVLVTHHLAAIRTQPETNLPSFFTGMAAFRKSARSNVNANSSRKAVFRSFYGDGSDIPVEYLDRLIEITDEIRVLHGWQEGDVTVYDNDISQHGREPWEGDQQDRCVMVSAWDNDVLPGPYGFGDWAHTVQPLDG
ncbi:Taurine catabolism dioxygenase TauD/TfdA [Penicillium capsulatum]|uniref:Taurine catabolism dioxygenase TauD/TfdA n=1 Tax=Penicillium capsulatum TaxID=69766 RepID=A0A9W9I7Y9_9EURO|nr:Taurine catabolism dioxygenase TauD/TfdA [Penicillium capsulatum]KAJ6136372.1 Taurine catabolism dioxygenase TauD/TfdA [Penicillium capsulatum]